MQIHVGPAHHLSTDLVDAAHTQAAFALTRFGRHIRSVSIRMGDTNGPRGGEDRECAITIHLVRPSEEVVVVHTDVDAFAALSRAMNRAARAVARRLDRRRSWRPAFRASEAGPTDPQSP